MLQAQMGGFESPKMEIETPLYRAVIKALTPKVEANGDAAQITGRSEVTHDNYYDLACGDFPRPCATAGSKSDGHNAGRTNHLIIWRSTVSGSTPTEAEKNAPPRARVARAVPTGEMLLGISLKESEKCGLSPPGMNGSWIGRVFLSAGIFQSKNTAPRCSVIASHPVSRIDKGRRER